MQSDESQQLRQGTDTAVVSGMSVPQLEALLAMALLAKGARQ